jgi:TetR/AcrR family transcriptional repressor of nem operon
MEPTDTRTRLLDAAQDLVQRVGANAMSYQHLSDEVGIRKASIHHHFPTKTDLLAALIDRYREDFLKVVDRITASDADAPARLKRFCDLFDATLQADACEKACPCGMLGAEIATLEPAAADRLKGFYRDLLGRIGRTLDEGRRDGSFQFDGRPADLARLLFSMLEGGMLVARVEGGRDAFRAMVRAFFRLIAPARR